MASHETVDDRVIAIDIDNSEAERHAPKTFSLLKKLEDALSFKNAAKSAEESTEKINNLKLGTLTEAVEALNKKFSVLGVASATAVSKVTTDLMSLATKMGNMAFMAPVTDGFNEYEQKMDSIKVMMNSSGESLNTVKDLLEELNVYADKTIYSFSDMTANVGKFTNAGVKLDVAVQAIKGISNEAALAGANTNEASRAMYNFAQALAQGSVKYIDWKSIENANMATVEFKQSLIDTAVELGTLKEQADGTYRSVTTNAKGGTSAALDAIHGFNESLAYQWMTTDVLTTTLGKYADETTEIGEKAYKAAKVVRTFSQVIDTAQEALGSGWGTTFELVLGDFNEAAELFTAVSETINDFIDAMAKARNDMLREWRDWGGRIVLLDALKNAYQTILAIAEPIREAFNNIFPPLTGQKLYALTVMLQTFTQNALIAVKNMTQLKDIFSGLFAAIDIVLTIMGGAWNIAFTIFSKVIAACGYDILDLLAIVGNWLVAIDEWIWNNELLNSSIEWVAARITNFIQALNNFKKAIQESGAAKFLADNLKTLLSVTQQSFTKILGTGLDAFKQFAKNIKALDAITPSAILEEVMKLFKNIAQVFKEGAEIAANSGNKAIDTVGKAISMLDTYIGGKIKGFMNTGLNILNGIKGFVSGLEIGFGEIAAVIAAFGVIRVGNSIDAFIGVLANFSKFPKSLAAIVEAASEVLESLANGIEKMSKSASFLMKMEGIKAIATSIIMLAAVLAILAFIPVGGLIKGGIALVAIVASLVVVSKAVGKIDSASLLKSTGALIIMTTSITMVATALKKLSKLDPANLASAVVSLTLTMLAFVGIMHLLRVFKEGEAMETMTVVISMAGALVILATALRILGKVKDVNKAVLLMGVCIASLAAIMLEARLIKASELGKPIRAALALLVLAGVLQLLSRAKPLKLLVGIGYMAMIVLALSVLSRLTARAQSTTMALNAFALSIGASMLVFSVALKIIASIKKENLRKALVAMGFMAAIVAALMMITSRPLSKNLAKAGVFIIGVAGAVVALSIAAAMLGHVKTEALVKGVAAISALMLVAGAVVAIAGQSKLGAVKIAGMVAVIGAMVASVAIIASLPIEGAIAGTAMLTALMIGLGIMMRGVSFVDIGNPSIKSIGKILLMLAGMSAIMVAIATLISYIPFGNADLTLELIGSVSAIMVAMSGCLTIISRGFKGMTWKKFAEASAMMGVLTGIVAAVAGVLYLIRDVNATNAIGQVTAFSVLLIALAVTTAALGAIGKIASGNAVLEGVKGLLYVVAGIAIIGIVIAGITAIVDEIGGAGTMSGFFERGIEVAENLGLLVGKLFGGLIGGIGAGMLGVLPEIGEDLAGFAKALEDVPDGAPEAAESLALAILALTGAEFISGIQNAIPIIGGKKGYESFATGLGTMAEGVSTFVEKFEDVDIDWDSIKPVAEVLQLLASAAKDIPNEGGWLATWVGDNKLDVFALEVKRAIPKLVKANEKASEVENWKPLTAATKMIGKLAKVADSIPNAGGILAAWVGDNTLTSFAEDVEGAIPDFVSMNGYAALVKNWEPAYNFIDVVSNMADVARKIPNTGGIFAKWLGDNSLSGFGDQLDHFISPMMKFVKKTHKQDGNFHGAFVCVQLISKMAEAAEKIPGDGGFFGKIFGSDTGSVDKFGKSLESYAKHLVNTNTNLGELSENDMDKVVKAVGTLSDLAAVVDEHPDAAENINNWMSDTTLSTFGDQMNSFITPLVNFINATATIGSYHGAFTAIRMVGEFAKVAKTVPSDDWMTKIFGATNQGDVGTFGQCLQKFTKSVLKVIQDSQSITDLDQIQKVCDAITMFSDLAKANSTGGIFGVFKSDDGDIGMFGTKLESLGTAITNFQATLQGTDVNTMMNYATDFKKVLATIVETELSSAIEQMNAGIEEIEGKAKEAYETLEDEAKKAKDKMKKIGKQIGKAFIGGVRGIDKDLKDTGKYLMQGLTKGVEDNTDDTIKAVTKAAGEITGATNEAFDIHSPSGIFAAIGEFLMRGLTKGIDLSKFEPIKTVEQVADEITGQMNQIKLPDLLDDTTSVSSIQNQVNDMLSGITGSTTKAKTSAEKAKEAIDEFRKSIEDTVKSSSKLFDEFSKEEDMSAKQMIKNLNSQVEGIKQWYTGLQAIAAMGVDRRLVKALAELGPEALTYVNTILTMTDKQLATMNQKYAQRLTLNSKSANAITQSLFDVGYNAGTSYVEGIEKGKKDAEKKASKKATKASKKTEAGSGIAKVNMKDIIGKNEVKIENPSAITTQTIKNLNKAAPVLEQISAIINYTWKDAIKQAGAETIAGTKQLQNFANNFLQQTANFKLGTKAIEQSAIAIDSFVMSIYKVSDAYGDDSEAYKEATKAYNKALNARNTAEGQYVATRDNMLNNQKKIVNKATKMMKKYAKDTSKAGKQQYKYWKEQKKTAEKTIADIEKGANTSRTTQLTALKNVVTQAEKELKSAAKDVAAIEDEMTQHAKESYAELISTISGTVQEFLNPLNIAVDAGIDLFSEFKSSANDYAKAEKSLEEHQASLTAKKKEEEELRSKIWKLRKENTVESRHLMEQEQDRLAALQNEISELESQIEQDQSDMAAASQTTAQSVLLNMRSQIKGVRDWNKKLKELAGRGIAAGLLQELRDMGPSAIDTIDAFISMTDKQLEEANKHFQQKQALNADVLLETWKIKKADVDEWAAGIAKMATMGFDQAILDELSQKGVDSLDYVRAFLSMSKSEIKEFNNDYASMFTLSDQAARDVVSSLAYAGAQGTEEFTKAIGNLSKSDSDENKALTDNAKAIGQVIQKAINGKEIGKNTLSELLFGLQNCDTAALAEAVGPAKTALSREFSDIFGNYLGQQVIAGLSKGLNSKAGKNAVTNLAALLVGNTKNLLGIHSPSTVFEEIGEYVDKGLALGISDNATEVTTAAESTLGTMISMITQAAEFDGEFRPMITPVLDLTEIQNGSNRIQSMLNGVNATTSVGLANTVKAKQLSIADSAQASISREDITRLLDAIDKIDGREMTFNNNFTVEGGGDAREIANQVSVILQRQVERRNAVWA